MNSESERNQFRLLKMINDHNVSISTHDNANTTNKYKNYNNNNYDHFSLCVVN